MPFIPLDYESWQSVCRPTFDSRPFLIAASHIDTGAEKKELCLKLGAEKWVDFRETKDLVKDIKEAAAGDGPHAALVSAASVSPYIYGHPIAQRNLPRIEHCIRAGS
jgi:hypothetical protein